MQNFSPGNCEKRHEYAQIFVMTYFFVFLVRQGEILSSGPERLVSDLGTKATPLLIC
jgi:hypothetical protein